MREKHAKKSSKAKKIAIWTAIVILTIIIGMVIAAAIFINGKLGKINYVEIKEEEIEINQGLEEKLKGYRNIALFGVDARKDTYSGTRSDGIIIASINQDTNDVKLTSVYRDTYVQIDGHGLDKITHAYAYGGAKLAINTLNKNLDLNIKEFVALNFYAVIETVDEMNGITIDVEPGELKYLNDYVADMHNVMGTPNDQLLKSGKQNLSGVQALGYARIRYTAGGDAKRTERMRIVLTAIFNKAKTMGAAKLNSLLDVLLPRVSTNINSNEILSFATQISKYKIGDSIGWPYETRDFNSGIYYGVPVTLQSNVERLHKEVFNENNYEISSVVKKISDSIINKTGYKK